MWSRSRRARERSPRPACTPAARRARRTGSQPARSGEHRERVDGDPGVGPPGTHTAPVHVVVPGRDPARPVVVPGPRGPARAVGQLLGLQQVERGLAPLILSLIHISEPTRLGMLSYAVF